MIFNGCSWLFFLNQKANERVKTMSHFFVNKYFRSESSTESRLGTKINFKRWILCTYSILVVVSFNEALLIKCLFQLENEHCLRV